MPEQLDILEPSVLRQRILECTACTARKEADMPTPFWPRETPSPVMMIGRNPGINEDKQGLPFVGKGGKVFQGWLNGLNVERDQIWLTNLLKCYTRSDRKPKGTEITTCWDLHLRREIAFCRPDLIVSLGSEAFTATTGLDRLSYRHGIIYDRRDLLGAYVMGVIHPGSAMRSGDYMSMLVEDGEVLKPLLPYALAGKLNEGLPEGTIAQ